MLMYGASVRMNSFSSRWRYIIYQRWNKFETLIYKFLVDYWVAYRRLGSLILSHIYMVKFYLKCLCWFRRYNVYVPASAYQQMLNAQLLIFILFSPEGTTFCLHTLEYITLANSILLRRPKANWLAIYFNSIHRTLRMNDHHYRLQTILYETFPNLHHAKKQKKTECMRVYKVELPFVVSFVTLSNVVCFNKIRITSDSHVNMDVDRCLL